MFIKTYSDPPKGTIFHLLFFLLLLVFVVNSLKTQKNYDEGSILLKLNKEFGVGSYGFESWNSSESHHCNWEGIKCDTRSFVSGILLKSSYLSIKKFPNVICDLKHLKEIDLSESFIPGEIPISILNCSKLQVLDLSGNQLVGQIPNDIGRLSNLRLLNLGLNNFTGHVPSSVGNLHFLRSLSLHQNQFNGSFPSEIGNLSNLEDLCLSDSGFSPSKIPNEFSKLIKLKSLDMSNISLYGEIPDWIGNFSKLDYLQLARNSLAGKIPKNLFLLKNLNHVYLSDNRLSGEIPTEIECLNMDIVDLSNNELTGFIPEGIVKLKKLTNLDLSQNNLSGELSQELGLHSKLRYLDVSGNRFSGNLPENLCFGDTNKPYRSGFHAVNDFVNKYLEEDGEVRKKDREKFWFTYFQLEKKNESPFWHILDVFVYKKAEKKEEEKSEKKKQKKRDVWFKNPDLILKVVNQFRHDNSGGNVFVFNTAEEKKYVEVESMPEDLVLIFGLPMVES
ncbi:hypothetical protein C5167_029033 [Papaver somniferum]|nr:hypothetical protein C5167_029033 [Papaver somniferum]